MAVLSVNLGFINLFPIRMLDGGHLLFYAIEGIRRRPLGEKIQEYSFRFGLLLILTLFIVKFMIDFSRDFLTTLNIFRGSSNKNNVVRWRGYFRK